MKRWDEREGVLDAKLCDWQAVKGSRAFPVCGSDTRKDGLCCKPASTLTFSKRTEGMGSEKKLPETIMRYEMKPIKSQEIFSL